MKLIDILVIQILIKRNCNMTKEFSATYSGDSFFHNLKKNFSLILLILLK